MQTDHVEPQDPARSNSPKVASKAASPMADTATFAADADTDGFCYWNDKKYSDGGTVCDNHRRYECWNGKWAEIGDC